MKEEKMKRTTNWLGGAYPPFNMPLECDTEKDIKRLLKSQKKSNARKAGK